MKRLQLSFLSCIWLVYFVSSQTILHRYTRIVDGWPTSIENIPFIVQSYGGVYICAGSIIAPKWILTAEHCTEKNVYGISYGQTNFNFRANKETFIRVERIYRFNYTQSFGTKDIALMKLKKAIPYSEKAQPAMLPALNYEVPGNYETDVLVVGWGLTENNEMPKDLRETVLKVVSNDECATKWMESDEILKHEVAPWVLCAAYRDHRRSPSPGDSGGPAILQDGSLVGIVSFSASDYSTMKLPAGFMKVSHFISQIEKITGLKRNSTGYLSQV